MDDIEETLFNLIRTVPGSTMAGLLAMDGVGVQMALSDSWQETDQDVIEIELAALAVAVQRAAKAIAAAESPEFFFSTARANFLGAMVDPAYFLVLGLEPSGDLERAGEALGEACLALGA